MCFIKVHAVFMGFYHSIAANHCFYLCMYPCLNINPCSCFGLTWTCSSLTTEASPHWPWKVDQAQERAQNLMCAAAALFVPSGIWFAFLPSLIIAPFCPPYSTSLLLTTSCKSFLAPGGLCGSTGMQEAILVSLPACLLHILVLATIIKQLMLE